MSHVEASLSVLSLLPPAPPMPDAMARRIGAVLAEKADEAAARSFGAWWKALLSPRFLVGAAVACALAFVVAPVDVSALRHERQSRIGHHMLAHLRTEAYEVYRAPAYLPRSAPDTPASYAENVRRIEIAKGRTRP